MIKINLLPEEYRKKKASFSEIIQQYKSLAIPVAGLVIGVIVLVSLIIVVYPKWQDRTLNRLEARWKGIEKDYQEAMRLKKEEKELKDRLDTINYITAGRLIWAAKLNEISDALPGEIQLTEMAVKTEEFKDKPSRDVLVISGLVPAFPGERAIEEFMKSLKGNPGFAEDFPQIELPLTETTSEGLKQFILKCYLAEKYVLEETRNQKPETREKKPKARK